MKLIVCLDDRCGMAFNKRRQSRDRIQLADMRELVGDSTLAIAPYSERLIADGGFSYTVYDNPLSSDEEYCFLETQAPTECKLDGVVIYRWGRSYPSDVKFTLDISLFNLVEVREFVGSSHEKIIREIYEL